MIVFFMSLFPSQNSIRHLFMAAADMDMQASASPKEKAARACGGSACLSLSKPYLTMRCHRHRPLLRGQGQSSISVCVSFTNIQG
jgi:hypothetical protein